MAATFGVTLLFADSAFPQLAVRECCHGQSYLGKSFPYANYKTEHVLAQLWALTPPTMSWIVFTEVDVWWNQQVPAGPRDVATCRGWGG